MKKVLHVSSECYPAAKAGGMGDVVGALPIYLPLHKIDASVVIPKYKTKWINQQKFTKQYKGSFMLGGQVQVFVVEKIVDGVLAFPFYCIDLPGLFDRDSIYLAEDGHGFTDEPKRNIAFQTAVVEWLIKDVMSFDLIHVHDHMTGLIPFFMQHCPKYQALKNIPAVLTIHNGAYRGIFEWEEVRTFLPVYDRSEAGLLDWDEKLNSLAAAIKCAWTITTVSPAYMKELMIDSDTLVPLYKTEADKCEGILNGIDGQLWDPSTDDNLTVNFSGDWKAFKSGNKSILEKKYNLIRRRPLIGFIGRFAFQKGADLLMDSISICLQAKMKFNAFILGSGDKKLEEQLKLLMREFPREVGAYIGYDESLARQIYAGCDFLMMPSRFEPCGLNQLYSMRYGTIPIASHKGGLIDTVVDLSDDGQGIVIKELNEEEISIAMQRAIDLYKDKEKLGRVISSNASLDYSWKNSAGLYSKLYSQCLKK